MAVTRSLAGAVKAVIDTPILSKEGNIAYESENVYEQTVDKLPNFTNIVEEVKQVEYNVKPIEAKVVKASGTKKVSATSTGTTVLRGARNVFAFVLGFYIATLCAEDLAFKITNGMNKFLFLDSFTANKIALWLLLFSSITMLIGCFRGRKVEKLCGWGSGISLSILYVQYCRTVELMSHYIIFSIVAIVVLALIFSFFDGKKKKWQFGMFYSLEAMCMAIWPLGFLVYAFFSKFIGFSTGFCLVVTSILMSLICVF